MERKAQELVNADQDIKIMIDDVKDKIEETLGG
jgi:hypothetical protein